MLYVINMINAAYNIHPGKNEPLAQLWGNVGSASQMAGQHYKSIGSMCRVCRSFDAAHNVGIMLV